ncbi:MAG TPA: T6SS immunity protein Tdi1 domain-containing protein [Steroidobacteraceae bacterium]|nr:T6SS immunity protein Tdi1 domain-containing protein [Steroidobacteraceae bacterium]
MNINDYLIAQDGKDWSRLLSYWIPPLPAQFGLWLVNRLGDVFVVAENESIRHLNVGTGECTQVARNREHFAQILDMGNNAEQWLRFSVVDACRRAGMQLGPFECYGFKIPPTLGGDYEVANLAPTNLAVHYSYQAYICKQTEVYWVPPA